MNARWHIPALLLAALSLATPTHALVLCQARNGTLKAREACKKKETVVDPAALGLQGPPGPPGPATGAAGGALGGTYPNPVLAAGAVTGGVIAPGAVGPAQLGVVPAVRVGRSFSNSQTMPSGVYTQIQWDPGSFDTAGMYNAATPQRLTAPIDGIYLVTVNVLVDGESPNPSYELIDLATVGGTVLAEDTRGPLPANFRTPLHASALVKLTAGTGVRVSFNHAAGVPLSIDSNTYTNFSMVWVGPGS